ncbi:MAG: triose-phosphate isomerase [Anaerolineales bacterium]|nr:triose-phosphate isomerase [Anaerolineales bacterium]
MRTPLVAGNWKLNKTAAETKVLIEEMLPGLEAVSNVDNLICPSYLAIPAAAEMLKDSKVALGAQNVYWEEAGAFTGEVAPDMVAEFCEFVIIGHSERRAYFGETDESVNRRTKAALAHGLIPVVCVGETLAENEAGKTDEVVSRQMRDGLAGLGITSADQLVIAYEPVWAIGTGKAAYPEDASRVIGQSIRPVLAELFGDEIAQGIRVLYGGSVKPSNARDFFSEEEVDGALVGGASLKADDFIKITEAAA